MPIIKQRYEGIKGKVHGEKKLKKPAQNAITTVTSI